LNLRKKEPDIGEWAIEAELGAPMPSGLVTLEKVPVLPYGREVKRQPV